MIFVLLLRDGCKSSGSCKSSRIPLTLLQLIVFHSFVIISLIMFCIRISFFSSISLDSVLTSFISITGFSSFFVYMHYFLDFFLSFLYSSNSQILSLISSFELETAFMISTANSPHFLISCCFYQLFHHCINETFKLFSLVVTWIQMESSWWHWTILIAPLNSAAGLNL